MLVLFCTVACGDDDGAPARDGGHEDAGGPTDGGIDGGPMDAGRDASPPGDAGPPEDGIPLVSLEVDSEAAAPSGTVGLTWSVEGDVTGLDLVVFVRTPGPAGPFVRGTPDRPYILPGFAIASGPARFLAADGSWGTSPGSLAPSSGSAGSPTLDADGEWAFFAYLRDPSTGEPRTELQQRIVRVSGRPAIRLLPNRLAGTTFDRLEVKLLTIAGAMPADVKIVASLTTWDAGERSLPSLEPGAMPAYVGPARDGEILLYASDEPAENWYLFQAWVMRADDSPLGYAAAHVYIGGETRTWRPTGQFVDARDPSGREIPLASSGALGGAIEIWDAIANQPIAAMPDVPSGSSGYFGVELPPGHYFAVGSIDTTEGRYFGVSWPFLVWERAAHPITISVTEDPTPLPTMASAAFTAADLATDRLPKPRVRVIVDVDDDVPLDVVIAFVERLAEAEPDLALVTDGMAERTAYQALHEMLTGTDGDHTQQALASSANQDFYITLRTTSTTSLRQTLVRVVQLAPLNIIHEALMVRPRSEMLTTAQIEALVTELTTPSLLSRIRAVQDRPIVPRFRTTIDTAVARPGDPVVFTARLGDIDGSATAMKDLVVVQSSSWRPSFATGLETTMMGTTDAAGMSRLTFTAPSPPPGQSAMVDVQASLRRPSGQLIPAPPVSYRVQWPGAVIVTPAHVHARPGTAEPLTVRFFRDDRPVPDARISLATTLGTLGLSTLVTSASGEASTTITADRGGYAVITAEVVGGTEMERGDAFVLFGHPIFIRLEASPSAVMVPIPSTIRGAVFVGGLPLAGATVLLERSIGRITPSAVTDAAGEFTAEWVPQAGSGVATVTATVRYEGTEVGETVSIAYDSTMVPPDIVIPGAYGGNSRFTFDCVACTSGDCSTMDLGAATLDVSAAEIVYTQSGTPSMRFMMVALGGGTFRGVQSDYWTGTTGWAPIGAAEPYTIEGTVDAGGRLFAQIYDRDSPRCHRYDLSMTRM